MSLVDKYDEELMENIAKLEKASAEGENMARDFMRSHETEESVIEKVVKDARKRGEPIHWQYGSSKHMLDLMEWMDSMSSIYQSFPFRIGISRFYPSDCDVVLENFRRSINQEALTIKESEVLLRLMDEVMDINYSGWEAANIARYYPTADLMSFTANLLIKYSPDDLFKSSANEMDTITSEWWKLIQQRIIKECNIPHLEYIIEQMHLPDVDVDSAISSSDIESLIRALDYNLFQVKEKAKQALVEIEEQAIRPLISALDNDRSNVREAAAETLGRIGDPVSIESLVHILKDDDLGVRMAVGNALAKIGKPAIPALINTLGNKKNDTRKTAIEALGKIKDPRAIESLILLLKDEDIGIRLAVENALKDFGEPVINSLIKVLDSGNINIRTGAAKVLGNIRATQALDGLHRLLKSKYPSDRSCAIEALEKIASRASTENIIKSLKDKEHDVRRKAMKALGVIGDVGALTPLMNILKKHDDEKRNAFEAISEISKKRINKESKEIAEPLTRELINMLEDKYNWSQASVILMMMNYPVTDSLISELNTSKNKRIRKQIPQVLAGIAERDRQYYTEILDILCRALQDNDKEVKVSAAFALEKLQDPSSADALYKALEDRDVRFAAELALKKIGVKNN